MLALRPALAAFFVAALVLGNLGLVFDQLVVTDHARLERCTGRLDRAKADADRVLARIEQLDRIVAELARRIDEALRLQQQKRQQRIDEQREQQAPIRIDRCCTTDPLCCV